MSMDHTESQPAYASVTSTNGGTNQNENQNHLSHVNARSNSPDVGMPVYAVANLPLEMQIAFRRKMFAVFAIQVLTLTVFVSLVVFAKALTSFATSVSKSIVLDIVVVASCLMCLVGLYVWRNKFPLNWCCLLLLTLFEAAFFIGISVLLKTKVVFYNCMFTLLCVLIMIALSGVRVRGKQSDVDQGDGSNLLSSQWAGIIAYVLVELLAIVIHLVHGDYFVTLMEFALTSVVQALIIFSFASSASAMYREVSADAYMHGVIYFYANLILMVIAV